MHFTREPILETVITPKEGYNLVIRNSSGGEEYLVDAVEVISFGHSYFLRNMEKPKVFLLPLAEYEVFETRQVRTVLKKPQAEKSIKIGRQSKLSGNLTPPSEEGAPKEKERTRTRKRENKEPRAKKEVLGAEKGAVDAGEVVPPVIRRTLLPPPKSLISEQISRYKDFVISQSKPPPEEEEKVTELKPEKSSEEELQNSFLGEEEKILDIHTSDSEGDETP